MDQKQLILEAMKSCVLDLDTADALFTDVLDMLSSTQLDTLEDLITNHYGIEDPEEAA